MSGIHKKSPALKQKQPEGPNKKALIWVGSLFGAVVIVMAVLLIVNQ